MTFQSKMESPAIWRCAACGALVHPADEGAPAAWCMRCGRMVQAIRDGARRPA
jgi:DNA-directed RNA polymerase subunit RPC12/RpoP